MDTLSDERVLEIIAGCEGVTPGPWTAFYKHKYDEYHVGVGSGAMKLALFSDGCPTENPQLDSEHIARLDPQTVSSLATELLALRKRVGELEAWQDISTAPTGRLAPKIMGAWHIGQGTWVQQVVYWGYDDRWYTTWDDTTATPSHWHPLQEDPPLPTPKRQKLAAALRMEGK